MASDNLRELEKDVEAARAKLAGDLSTMREPGVYSGFADNLKRAALDTKDTLVEDAKSRARSVVEEITDTLKAKAAANPTAVLVLGTGVALRLIRNPPVVAALIGGGLYSLLRTESSGARGRSTSDYMDEAKQNLRQRAGELAAKASSAGHHAAERARDTLADVGTRAVELARGTASELASEASEAARRGAELARGGADAISQKTAELSETVRGKLPKLGGGNGDGRALPHENWANGSDWQADEDAAEDYDGTGRGSLAAYLPSGTPPMDKVLLGLAGVAVAGAVAAVLRRRLDDDLDEDDDDFDRFT